MPRPRIRREGEPVKVLPVQLSQTLYDELEQHCAVNGVSKAHVVRQALKRVLRDANGRKANGKEMS